MIQRAGSGVSIRRLRPQHQERLLHSLPSYGSPLDLQPRFASVQNEIASAMTKFGLNSVDFGAAICPPRGNFDCGYSAVMALINR
jgi:hypothetical protein